ncbi:MAG: hypothetical protein QW071_05250 [Candidatus Bathyarchaeia archaeon]
MGYSKGALISDRLSREEVVKAVEGEKDSLSKIIKAIHVFGPRNYTAISRITGIPAETVRYKIKTQLRNRGIRVYAHVDYGRIGLARYALRLRFSHEVEAYAPKILDKLAEVGYLYYYGRVIPRWEYVCNIALPPDLELKYRVFLDGLVDRRIIEWYSMSRLTSVRYLSMDTRFYDFDRGIWSIPFDSECYNYRDELEVSIEEDVCRDPRIDSIDLKMIAWSQVDAYLSPTDIAKRIMCEPKKALYHYKEHIVKQGIIKRYIVSAGWSQQDMRSIIIRFEGIEREDIDEARRVMERIPFTVRDTVSENPVAYTSYLVIPKQYMIPVIEYISERVSTTLKKCMEYELIDSKIHQSYTIPYEMYDDDDGWIFNVNDTLYIIEEYSKLMQSIEYSNTPLQYG